MEDIELLLRSQRFDVVRRVAAAEDGRMQSREIVRHPGSVAILPLLDDGRLCLIQNFRVSVGRRLLEIPAGTLEPDEEPLSAAHRELAEETGYRARRMEFLTAFHPSPGILDERMHLFLATGLESGPTALEDDEDIRVVLLSQEAALAMVRAGRVEDAKTVIGVLYFQVFGALPPH